MVQLWAKALQGVDLLTNLALTVFMSLAMPILSGLRGSPTTTMWKRLSAMEGKLPGYTVSKCVRSPGRCA